MSSVSRAHNIPTKKELRVFSLIWVVIFLVIGTVPLALSGQLRIWPFIVSAAFLAVLVTYPKAVLPLYKIWVIFGGFIGRVNAKIILGIVFYLVITPIGIVTRMLGKDLLGKKIDKERETYWEGREFQPGSMKNQF